MVSQAATSLSDALGQKVRELEEAAAGIGDETAGQRPAEGQWCVKEVLSHLCGDEGEDFGAGLRRFLEEDTPLIGVVAGLPYFTPQRQKMSVSDLLATARRQYGEIAIFLGGLRDDELAHKARIPLLKETPIGEYATLAQWAGAIINFHLPDHINQLRTIRDQVGA